MSRVMMLVGEEGATLAETRVGEGAEAHALAEGQLREEALVFGFSVEEVRAATLVMAGDPPNQP